MSSIRLRLLKWLIGPLLLINLAGAALTYSLAWLPAQLAFDQSLSTAVSALRTRLGTEHGALRIDLPKSAEAILRADDADVIYFAVRSGAGQLLAGDADLAAEPRPGEAQAAAPTTAFGVVRAFDGRLRGEAVRVAATVVRVNGQSAQIAVAKTLRKREQIRSSILQALLPLEALVTLALIATVWFSVGNGLRPLTRMRSNLQGRDVHDFAPLRTDTVPDELNSVVHAFNELLAQVQGSAKSQQDFLANMAHQLRTPLAGLKLQLEWLAGRHPAEDVIPLMQASTERMIRHTNQLLALARAEPSRADKPRRAPIDLALLIGDAVQYFVESAAKKDIDIGFDLAPSPLLGDAFQWRDLIDNLIDNAVRYTPVQGNVTVTCRPGLLMVEDSGPGIPPHKREAVFSRFVRLDEQQTGSGLGLAIVRDIARAHGATVHIEARKEGPGAVFIVRFQA